ncbi:MAG: Ig-like domain-containing protein [Bacteroidales bacterium]|nr:Ig-like domain-containing protein [Bacteroidales bacterium]MDD3663940.1 Ig-like domain-containing protein [Bacteroidales bacterium]
MYYRIKSEEANTILPGRVLFFVLMWLGIGLMLQGCATKGMLGGGPKDTAAPKVISENPPLGSIRFNGDRIEITFDEFVKLKDAAKNILISPPVVEKPDFKLRGKTLSVIFNEPLADSTTYSIFFGEAIADITEGNTYNGYTYVFSTGDLIDTISATGVVLDAFSGKPIENVLTGLYNLPDSVSIPDSMVMKHPPRYISRCSKEGTYKLEYLAPGNYLLVALLDQNGNYCYNPYSESFAFSDTIISLKYNNLNGSTKDTLDTLSQNFETNPDVELAKLPDSIQQDSATFNGLSTKYSFGVLRLFSEQDSIQRITSRDRTPADAIRVTYRYPLIDPAIEILNPDSMGPVFSVFSPQNDTIDLWIPKPVADTVHLIISDKTGRTDTLHLPSKKKEIVSRRRNQRNSQLNMKSNLSGQRFPYFNTFQLSFDQPVEFLDTSLMQLVINDDTLQPGFKPSATSNMHFRLKNSLKPGDNCKLLVADSAIKSITGLYNGKSNYSFTLSSPEEYGLCRIKLTTSRIGVNQILYWLTENEKIMASYQFSSDTTITISNQQPGKYRLKAVLDLNHNNRWDTGEYMELRQPEPVDYRPNLIEIRANWELEEDWKLKY